MLYHSDVYSKEITSTLEMRQRGSLKVRPVVNHYLAAPGHLRPCQPVNQSLRLYKKRKSTRIARLKREKIKRGGSERKREWKRWRESRGKKWNRKWSGRCNKLQYMTPLKRLLLVVPRFLFSTHYSKPAMFSWRLPRHCARISRAVVDSESILNLSPVSRDVRIALSSKC